MSSAVSQAFFASAGGQRDAAAALAELMALLELLLSSERELCLNGVLFVEFFPPRTQGQEHVKSSLFFLISTSERSSQFYKKYLE